MRTPADLLERGEVIVRNNGDAVELEGGELIEAGELAVVARADRVAAVELMFGRFELEPDVSHLSPPAWLRARRGWEVNSAGVDVSRGVELR